MLLLHFCSFRLLANPAGLALAPFNVLAGGRVRTDAEEEKRRQTGERGRSCLSAAVRVILDILHRMCLGRINVGTDWERTPDERKMCLVLEEIAKQVGTESIQAGEYYSPCTRHMTSYSSKLTPC